MQHTPVLMEEVLQQLMIQPDGVYVDATFGRGGHAVKILAQLALKGRLFALDKDHEAIQAATESRLMADDRFSFQQSSFILLQDYMQQQGYLGKVNGILLDLGVSSPQLDEPSRGFSFLRDGPLDMRMDTSQNIDAKQWIGSASANEIAKVLKDYGEERYAPRIAQAIVTAREKTPIMTTGQLADIVSKAHPRWEVHKHPATRTFQAIRIFINGELDALHKVLQQSLEVLAVGGRLLVISFHSLEDRIVKQFIQAYGSSAHWPKDLPLTQAQIQTSLRIRRINGAIRASEKELQENPRARSATLRVMEKIQ